MKKWIIPILLLISVVIILLPIEISLKTADANTECPPGECEDNVPVIQQSDPKHYAPWCRFEILYSKTGDANYSYIEFVVSGLFPKSASIELFGLGTFNISGLNCVQYPMEHKCYGNILGPAGQGEAKFYAGKLSVANEENAVCSVSKALVPPPVYTPSDR